METRNNHFQALRNNAFINDNALTFFSSNDIGNALLFFSSNDNGNALIFH